MCAIRLTACLLPVSSNSGRTVVGGVVVANVATVVGGLILRNQKVLLTGAKVGRGIVTSGAEGRDTVVCMLIPRDCRRSERSEKKALLAAIYVVGKGSLITIECIWHTFIIICLAVLACVLYVYT